LRARLTTVALTALAALGSVASVNAATAGAASVRWIPPTRIDPRNGGLTAVACASPKLCVAVDESGFALTTTHPTRRGSPWGKPFRIDAGANAPLTGIACPTTKLCVAIDAGGNVITSKHPTGGSRAWARPVHVDTSTAPGGSSAGLTGISCPTATLCVAVDGATPANAVTSITPTAGASGWKMAAVGGLLTSIVCPSTTLCVAAGSQHYFSASPLTGASSWHPTGIQTGGGAFSDIACPSITLCAATGYGSTSIGLITSTAKPTGGASNWSTAPVEPNPPTLGSGLLDGVGCMGIALCVATDSRDNAYMSTNPSSGAWTGPTAYARKSAPTATWSSIGCTTTLCVAVDSNGWAATGVSHR
jgi:hypothetical protein